MKKKSSIIKLVIIGVILAIGMVLSLFSFDTPFGFYDYNSTASSIKLGLDLKGGIYAVYDTDSVGVDDFDTKLVATQTRLQDLIVSKGYTEAVLTVENNTRLRVEVPDVDDPSEIFELIGKPADLAFVLDGSEETLMTGEHIVNAVGYYDTTQAAPVVSLEFDSEGAKQFGEITSANVNSALSIYLVYDGVRESQPISTATINEAIMGGRAQITMSGQDTEAAENLASQIMSGTFDLKLTLLESSTISPTLGEQALTLGIIAGVIGLALVIVFLAIRYRLLGVVAAIALIAYAELMLFFLAVLPWVQLTLPGIAGIILSLGMAVDGNIVIYERIRDEYASGKSILASCHAGFKKATVAIFDSNITTIIASIVLLIFGSGSIAGFGLTLLIGIILSLFTTLVITRILVGCFTGLNSENPKLYNLKRLDNTEDVVTEIIAEETAQTPETTDEGVDA